MIIGKSYLSRKYREGSGGDGGDGGKPTVDTPTLEELQAKIAGLENEKVKITRNRDDLLSEKKAAQEKTREAEEQLRLEADEKAKAKNDYKQLFESSELKRKELQEKITTQEKVTSSSNRKAAATEMANELAEGKDVALLARFFMDRIDFKEGEIKILDKKGSLTVSSIEDLKNEFKNDDTYTSLMKKSKASGGSANGGSGSGATGQDNPWKKDTLNLTKQAQLIKDNPELATQMKKAAGK